MTPIFKTKWSYLEEIALQTFVLGQKYIQELVTFKAVVQDI